MFLDLPVSGFDYDYASRAIRCRADRAGAQIFLLEKTAWRKPLRILALDVEDARECADLLLPAPPIRSGPSTPSTSFASEVERRCGELVRRTVSDAQERRLVKILTRAVHEVVHGTDPRSFKYWRDYRKQLECVLFKLVRKQCRTLLEASAVSGAKVKAQAEAVAVRNTTRRALAVELKTARGRLRRLRKDIRAAELTLLPVANDHCGLHRFAPVPPPKVEATRLGEGLPNVSGIYFVWSDDRVVYVGQSRRLCGRCIIGGHHAIGDGDMLSWVEEPIGQLKYAEAFYIGVLKPERNFSLYR